MISAETRGTLRNVAWNIINAGDVIRTGITREGPDYHPFLAGLTRSDISQARLTLATMRRISTPEHWQAIRQAMREELQSVRITMLREPLRRAS
jgi:hypothetical protein